MKLFLLYLPLWGIRGDEIHVIMSLLKGKPNPNQNESRILGDVFFWKEKVGNITQRSSHNKTVESQQKGWNKWLSNYQHNQQLQCKTNNSFSNKNKIINRSKTELTTNKKSSPQCLPSLTYPSQKLPQIPWWVSPSAVILRPARGWFHVGWKPLWWWKHGEKNRPTIRIPSQWSKRIF